MILAGNQPYFIPYLGYWQLLNLADIYVIGDEYKYIQRGWINRNHILNNGQPNWLILPLRKGSDNLLIKERELSDIRSAQLIRKIDYIYHKAPNFAEGMSIFTKIINYQETNLAKFLHHSIMTFVEYLDIKTQIIRPADIPGNTQFKRENRIYDQCARLGADTYINAIGGMELYDFEEFKKRGITLKFLKTRPIEYKQFNHPFVPNLSILDVIMFNSREEVIKMLDCYDLIGE